MARPSTADASDAIRESAESWRVSASRVSATRGYWILTATCWPRTVARCTWPMLAAATGVGSNVSYSASSGAPRAASTTGRTLARGSGETPRWSSRSRSAVPSGRPTSMYDRICPTFIAIPFS